MNIRRSPRGRHLPPQPSRPRRAVTALTVAATVMAVATASGSIPSPATADDDPVGALQPGDRVLQTVAVKMGSDGSLTGIDGTTVTASADGSRFANVPASYSPDEVVGDLPVRVLTSYRTGDTFGTDLADLDGYTGRVQIDLTVQNLTVRPETISYDVAGVSRTDPALVGVPLTVTAAAVLGGTDPSSVVTPGSDTTAPATNGVLSQDASGATQVQWATILAPPQLSASATLRLVVDAKDFKAPVVDLSIQPGLVTDPSLGALVDAAFNPAASDERELQARTIKLIGDVNRVLARAGKSIAQVRRTLESSAETLGTQTVADLRGSVSSIATSMASLASTVEGLGSQLDSTLDATRSSSIGQLQQSVTTLGTLLGDTSATTQPAKVTGEGCESQVRPAATGRSVYASLLRVASRLDGYATSTKACKASLQKAILDSVGPAAPTTTICTQPSVTCALFASQTTFNRITQDLVASGETAIAALDPASFTAAVAAVDQLTERGTTAVASLGDLRTQLGSANLPSVLGAILEQTGLATSNFGGVRSSVEALHDIAVERLEAQGSMAAQNEALAAELCELAGDRRRTTEPTGGLSIEEVERLRSYLVAGSCPEADGTGVVPLHPPAGYDSPMSTKISESTAAWTVVRDSTDTEADSSDGLAGALVTLLDTLGDVESSVEDAQGQASSGSSSTGAKLQILSNRIDSVVSAGAEVKRATDVLNAKQQEVQAAVRSAFQDAATQANGQINANIDPEIRRVSEQSARDSAAVGASLEKSAAGLAANADEILSDGSATVEQQRARLMDNSTRSAGRINKVIDGGLAVISAGVSASNRDTQAATRLLTADLTKVLADLGTPRVRGTGLLGSLATNAATAGSADFQLALATDTASSYANVRGRDIAELLLRQAQTSKALERQATLPAFRIDVPNGIEHRTLYLFHLGG